VGYGGLTGTAAVAVRTSWECWGWARGSPLGRPDEYRRRAECRCRAEHRLPAARHIADSKSAGYLEPTAATDDHGRALLWVNARNLACFLDYERIAGSLHMLMSEAARAQIPYGGFDHVR
jgi:hypothetical protein